VRLVLAGSREGFNRLDALFRDGELSKLLGVTVATIFLSVVRNRDVAFLTQESQEGESRFQSRVVTIAFWDIVGLSEIDDLSLEPSGFAHFISEFCRVASLVVSKNGGKIVQFWGDGLTALFVTDQTGKNDNGADAAIRSALDLRDEFTDIAQKFSNELAKSTAVQPPPLGLRCGIHTGRAITGMVGAETVDRRIVFGSALDFAERMKDNADAAKQQILISDSTLGSLHQRVRTVEVTNLKVRSRPGEESKAFSVVEPNEEEGR
jgi:adenylate cyclase